jgi:hypothetical protein
MFRGMRVRYCILFLLLLLNTVAYGQNIEFTASVSKSPVVVGEQFEVVFTLNGNAESFNAPSFNGFEVLAGPNQSSSMTSINGKTTMSFSLSYVLAALKEGDLTINPASITAGGKQYRSGAIRLKVVRGNSSNQSGPSAQAARRGNSQVSGRSNDISKRLFIRAVASKTNVFQGEQLAVTYKLYSNVDLVANNMDKLPEFNGFWSQELKRNSQYVNWETEIYNGVRYNVAVLKENILFPERYGKLMLDPLAMTFVVRQSVPTDDPIEAFFGSYKEVSYKIKSAPVTINVKPLPDANKPSGFSGAVGNFGMGVGLDKKDIKANEAINYTVRITGSGNLKLMKAPAIQFPAGIEKYDPKINDQITETMNGVSGTREYIYLLIPRHEGSYKIEPFEFSYFNPASQKYVTLSSEQFDLKVARGAPGSSIAATGFSGQQDIKVLEDDIRYIKTDRPQLAKVGEEFYGSAVYYILFALGPLLFIAALVLRKWYREQNKDQIAVKRRNANRVAARHLALAQKHLQEGGKGPFYEAIYKGLYGYLGDMLNLAAADLNRTNIREKLALKGIDDDLITRLTGTLDLCEMARYSPVSGISEQEVFDKAKGIINDIENHV